MESRAPKDNIIPFEPRTRKRRKAQVMVFPEVRPPTRLETIGSQVQTRYMARMDTIRRQSIQNLSRTPYNAWGLPEKVLKR